MECKQGTCENIENLHTKINRVILCQKSKISWKQLGSITTVLIMILVGMTYRSLDAAQNATKERADNAKQIQVIQKDLEHIKDTNVELKKGQNDIKKQVQEIKEQRMTPQMFKRIIEDAIKEIPK